MDWQIKKLGNCKREIQQKGGNPEKPTNPGGLIDPKPTDYTITFHKNGGTKLSKSKVVIKENQFLGRLPKVQRKGYALKGWYTAKSGGAKVSVYTRVTKSQTIYAQWSKVSKPGKVKSLSVKKVKKGKMKVSYKRVSGAAGYEISYSSSPKFSQYSTQKLAVKNTQKTISGLWKNQVYYVRVRAYKLDSMGSKIYGGYCAKMRVKV